MGLGEAPLPITTATKNAGPARLPATTSGIWLSSNKTFGGDVLLAQVAVPSLEAGTKHQAVSTVTLPAVPPGQYYLIAQADSLLAVAETNEGDNLKTRPLVIGPDLTVAMTLVPSSPTSLSPTTISVITKNAGGTAPPSTTRLYRSANGRVDAASVQLAEFAVPILAPAASNTAAVTVTLPAGTYFLIAVVDAAGAVAEARETNNVKRVKKTLP